MSELENKLNNIAIEKERKIIPENIKKGVSIFGVAGTLEAGLDTSDATATSNDIKVGTTAYTANGKEEGTLTFDKFTPDYPNCLQAAKDVLGEANIQNLRRFDTIDKMNQSTGNKEGDLAVVYGSSVANLGIDTEFTKATLPDTVVLPEAFTGRTRIEFQAVDPSQRLDCYGDMDSNYMRCEFMTGNPETDYRINYSSTDGITYTKQEGTPAEITFEFPIKYGSSHGPSRWEDAIGYFFQVGSANFNGLFEFKENTWKIAPTQLNAKSEEVYKSTFYGANGVETGTLTENVSNSFADINAKVIYEIQQKYDTMTPKILTDENKTIDKNMYFIPVKADGTSLLDTSKVTDMNGLFSNCKNLKTIPLIDTSKATDMSFMFNECIHLSSIPLIDTSKTTDMNYMFQGCDNLSSIPLIDTSNVTNMDNMFQGCINLTTIPVLNTSKVTTTRDMFRACTNLVTISLINTSKVTSMNSMFFYCENLAEIPLIDTSNVTDMQYMFRACTNLTTIPLLNTSKVTDMGYMFTNCSSLSNESLNNILQMCINAKAYIRSKTLQYMGLSQEQTNRCQSLSNWSAFTSAGWTSGY